MNNRRYFPRVSSLDDLQVFVFIRVWICVGDVLVGINERINVALLLFEKGMLLYINNIREVTKTILFILANFRR